MFGGHTHCGDAGAGAAFDDDDVGVVVFPEPLIHGSLLLIAAVADPIPIAEHEDVGPGYVSAIGALGEGVAGSHGLFVQFYGGAASIPDRVAAGAGALHVMDGAVAFVDGVGGESGFLELAVHIGGEDKVASGLLLAPFQKDMEAFVGNGLSIQVHAVSVKAPGQLRVAGKPIGVGHVDETIAQFGEWRIGFPETFVTSEIRESRVHPHAGSGGYHQRAGGLDPRGRCL